MDESIRLRDVVEEDLEIFLAHEHDPENVRYADPSAGNTGSVRLLERLGFTLVGTTGHDGDGHLLYVLDERDGERGTRP